MKNNKSKFTASMLAFFLGSFGFHWFYLGRPLKGFLYLIFVWTFIPAFLALIDFCWLIAMREDKFDLKFNC